MALCGPSDLCVPVWSFEFFADFVGFCGPLWPSVIVHGISVPDEPVVALDGPWRTLRPRVALSAFCSPCGLCPLRALSCAALCGGHSRAFAPLCGTLRAFYGLCGRSALAVLYGHLLTCGPALPLVAACSPVQPLPILCGRPFVPCAPLRGPLRPLCGHLTSWRSLAALAVVLGLLRPFGALCSHLRPFTALGGHLPPFAALCGGA